MKKVLIVITACLFTLQLFSFGTTKANNKAVESIKDSLFYDAEEKLTKALEGNEDNTILNYNMALNKIRIFEEYNDRESLEEAVPFFEKAVKDTSAQVQFLTNYNRGNLHYNAEDYGGAINFFQQAASKLDSTQVDPDLIYNLANSMYKFGENNEEYDSLMVYSGQIYGSLLDQVESSEQPKLLHNMGNSAFKGENYSDAVNYYLNALKQNPEDNRTRENYEIALRKLEAQEQQQDGESQESEDGESQEEQSEQQQQSESQQKEEQKSKEKQQKESEDKQEQYQDMSKEDKEKLDAEKKLDALIQQQSQQNKDKDEKPKRSKKGLSGRYW
ncbi:MAG: hypothetical protein B6226_01920 [Candidatus Cloacimonetes bacterium 4572_65]|nr:MAG: hypothetical protein B6226_01920 [Candidatus Cloacimonetes bacterium 4572_65]